MRSTNESCLPPALLVLLLLAGLFPVGSALHVDGIKILMDVQPGETYTFPMGVGIDPGDPATDIAIEILGFGQSPDGSYVQVPPSEDTASWSARDLLSIREPVIHLEPGGSRSFNATIRVPAGAPAGGRYATIYIHPSMTQTSGSGAGVTTAVLVPVFLTIPGPGITETASIEDLSLAGTGAEVTLGSTGNHHFYGATAGVTVTDAAGNTIATGSSRPSVWALVPGGRMILKVPLSPSLPAGSYTVKAEARNGQGGPLLDTKTVTLSPGSSVGTEAAGTRSPEGAVATPAASRPTGLPGPDPVAITAFLSAAILLWSVRSRR
ncbi:MAG: hypothetical protein LUO96_03025 [Methanomicrobiales archaeon]|nr:hypothetical protein [Methanomicrobiales archaeon]